MKKLAFSILVISLLAVNTAIINAQSQDKHDVYVNEIESLNIKLLDPVDMISPSKNEDAMMAYNIGSFYMYQNRTNEAEKYLKEAVDLDPNFVDAYDHLGIVYRRQNRFSEAEAMYLKSIELNDRNKVPFINLAIIYRIQNRLNDAFQLYMHVVQILPDDPEGYYGIGELLFITDDYENSMMFFDAAIELYIELNSPYVYDAYYYKGLIYYYAEEYNEALRYLEEAGKGNPNNETLERVIRDIRIKIR